MGTTGAASRTLALEKLLGHAQIFQLVPALVLQTRWRVAVLVGVSVEHQAPGACHENVSLAIRAGTNKLQRRMEALLFEKPVPAIAAKSLPGLQGSTGRAKRETPHAKSAERP